MSRASLHVSDEFEIYCFFFKLNYHKDKKTTNANVDLKTGCVI